MKGLPHKQIGKWSSRKLAQKTSAVTPMSRSSHFSIPHFVQIDTQRGMIVLKGPVVGVGKNTDLPHGGSLDASQGNAFGAMQALEHFHVHHTEPMIST